MPHKRVVLVPNKKAPHYRRDLTRCPSAVPTTGWSVAVFGPDAAAHVSRPSEPGCCQKRWTLSSPTGCKNRSTPLQ